MVSVLSFVTDATVGIYMEKKGLPFAKATDGEKNRCTILFLETLRLGW
jgi:hypothetical protein